MYLAVSAAVIVITAVPVKFFAIVISPLLFTFTDLLFDEYVRLKNEYHKHGIGAMIYRSDISIDEIVEKCDAYYGCESHIALEFSVNKKPVMILSVDC